MRAILAVIVLIMITGGAMAEESKYQPNEIQSYRLQLKFKDAQLAQRDLALAQLNFNVAVNLLNAEGDKIRIENKWPEEVKFDADKLQFLVSQVIPIRPVPAQGGK